MNSSGKKRPLVQCRLCGGFCLSKDLQAHNGEPTTQSNGSKTPKQTQQQRGGVGGQGRRRRTMNDGGGGVSPKPLENGCDQHQRGCDGQQGFQQCQFPLIAPGKGLALREDNTFGTDPSSLVDTEKWDRLFPVELYGWQQRHSALVHPEVLNAVGALPRSAFLLNHSGKLMTEDELITLWPCSEVPPLRIALPHSMRSNAAKPSSKSAPSESPLLIRLRLVSTFSPPFTKLLLQPNTTAATTSLNDSLAHCWSKLPLLSHLSHFLRSYFANALLLAHQPLEVFYYGHQLHFDVVQFECQQQSSSADGGSELVGRMQNCSINGKCSSEEAEREDGLGVHTVSPFCLFSIDWGPVSGVLGEEEKDDPESLL